VQGSRAEQHVIKDPAAIKRIASREAAAGLPKVSVLVSTRDAGGDLHIRNVGDLVRLARQPARMDSRRVEHVFAELEFRRATLLKATAPRST
jgi:hypothetical protein